MNNFYRQIAWGLVFTVAVYAIIGLWTDFGTALRHLSTQSVYIAVFAFGLTLINYLLRFVKWHIFLKRIECNVPIGESFVIFIAGFLMAITPGKLGEIFKSYLIYESHSYSPSRTASVVIMERLTDLIGLFLLAGFGVATFRYGRGIFAASVIVVFGLIFVLNRQNLMRRLLSYIDQIPLIRKISEPIENAYRSIYELIDWWLISWTSLLSAAAWGMEAVAFYFIIDHLGGEVTLLVAAFVYSMTTIFGAVSFLPGGVGVTEGSMIGLLVLFAVFSGESLATAATYFIRLTTLWFGVIIGLFAFIWHQYRYVTSKT